MPPHQKNSRKPQKLTRSHFGRMQVISINDFERAQEAQLEYIMDSAVDQLELLTKPADQRPTVSDVIVRFGQLRLGDEMPQLRFDFEPPTTCRQWPGPRYGSFSLHKPLPTMPKMKSKGSKISRKHGQPDDFKQSLRPLKAPKPKKTKKPDVAPVMLTAKSSREPPLELLGLPPELRNAIWTLLALHDEPVEAQLRPIRPCKKLSKVRGTVVRRFPLEPVVASVSRQVRREVLSIFYGDNRFIFQKNACSMFKGYNMLLPATMEKWKPRQDVANFLTHLSLRFNAIPRSPRSMVVVFTLRRLPDSKITIEVRAEKAAGKNVVVNSQPCLCSEKDVISAVQDYDCGGDLTEMAMRLTQKRNEMIFVSEVTGGNRTVHFPKQETCERCERTTFEIVYSGL